MALVVYDVPSKCGFELIPLTLRHIRDQKPARRLAHSIDQHVRHAHFLMQNARILGFATRKEGSLSLTDSGRRFLEATPKMRGFLLMDAVLSSSLVGELVKYAGSLEKAAAMTIEQTSRFLMGHVVVSVHDTNPIEKVTADRRASSVRGWVSWLVDNLPRVDDDPPRSAQQSLESQ